LIPINTTILSESIEQIIVYKYLFSLVLDIAILENVYRIIMSVLNASNITAFIVEKGQILCMEADVQKKADVPR
jgi:hypothetical protein